MRRQECPVCGARVTPSSRYPDHLCATCVDRAVSADGRPLAFFNVDLSGGFAAAYRDTRERYPRRDCFVDGVACEADEAYFGGIVVRPTARANTTDRAPSVVAHSATLVDPDEDDDRWLADRALGLFYVANGSGPTYGGHHAPLGLDPGLDAFGARYRRFPATEPERLRAAFAAADDAMRSLDEDDRRAPAPDRPLRHFTAALTACSLAPDGTLDVAQVGDGRAYLLRGGALRLLVDDHTFPTVVARAGGVSSLPHAEALASHRSAVTRLLGLGEALPPDHAREALVAGDVVLLCTAGVWNRDDGDARVQQLMTATREGFRALLDGWGRGATAVRLGA